jgi:hypothetical protein
VTRGRAEGSCWFCEGVLGACGRNFTALGAGPCRGRLVRTGLIIIEGFNHLHYFKLVKGSMRKGGLLRWGFCVGRGLYETLGVPEEASFREIRERYLLRSKELHPDVAAGAINAYH